MGKGYYDEDEGEYIKGEWLDREPRELRDDDFMARSSDRRTGRSGKPGKTYSFRKKIVLEIDPLRGARVRRDSDVPYDDPYRVESGRSAFSFSETEKRHLTIASIILITAFILFLNYVLYDGDFSNIFDKSKFPILLSGALVAVLTGFLTHEMGHKFAAQKMGYRAEFRYSLSGLLLALFLSMFGLLIAAPGAVMIYGRLSKRENGITSLSGPAINTVWATLFLVAFFLMGMGDVSESGLMWEILWTIVYWGFFINTIFAAFNMLPIRLFNLDGYKILEWNKTVYFLFAGVVGFYVLIAFGVVSFTLS